MPNRKESLRFQIGRAASVLIIMGAATAWDITHREQNAVEPSPTLSAIQSSADLSEKVVSSPPQETLKNPLSPEERFQVVLSLMQSSRIPQVREAAGEYISTQINNPNKSAATIITDSHMFGSEPVDFHPIGGLEGKGWGVQKLISNKSLSENQLSPADWAVYLFYAHAFAQRVNSFPGTASERLEYMKTINPAAIWSEVWRTLGSEFGDRVSDLQLKTSWQAYQVPNQPPAVIQK